MSNRKWKKTETKETERYFPSEMFCGYQPPKRKAGTLSREKQYVLSHCQQTAYGKQQIIDLLISW